MQLVKVLAVVMGILILVGSAVVVGTIVKRAGTGGSAANVAVVLDEPAGTHISGIAATQDRLAVLLQGGGGPDRIVLVDTRTGQEAGSVALAR